MGPCPMSLSSCTCAHQVGYTISHILLPHSVISCHCESRYIFFDDSFDLYCKFFNIKVIIDVYDTLWVNHSKKFVLGWMNYKMLLHMMRKYTTLLNIHWNRKEWKNMKKERCKCSIASETDTTVMIHSAESTQCQYFIRTIVCSYGYRPLTTNHIQRSH